MAFRAKIFLQIISPYFLLAIVILVPYRVYSSPEGTYESKNFEVTNISAVYCNCIDTGFNMMGIIKNIDNKTHDNIQVMAELYNSKGELIGVETGAPFFSDIDPEITTPFKILVANVNQSALDHYIIIVSSSLT